MFLFLSSQTLQRPSHLQVNKISMDFSCWELRTQTLNCLSCSPHSLWPIYPLFPNSRRFRRWGGFMAVAGQHTDFRVTSLWGNPHCLTLGSNSSTLLCQVRSVSKLHSLHTKPHKVDSQIYETNLLNFIPFTKRPGILVINFYHSFMEKPYIQAISYCWPLMFSHS